MKGGTLDSGRSHAANEVNGRVRKALKISRLLELDAESEVSLRILEIGTGSGVIAHWFAGQGHSVSAVDVVDERVVTEGYSFTKVAGTDLPYEDQYFDVIISNHVIEHVGDGVKQAHHLAEMRRVIAPHGKAYLAMPNRWMLVEPHYRLIFLSWMPRPFADAYVRVAGKGGGYDCRPLTAASLQKKFLETGWHFHQHHYQALVQMVKLEGAPSGLIEVMIRILPRWSFSVLAPIFPTLIYTLRPAN